MAKIMVFIPMYNCEKQIIRVIQQFNIPIQEIFSEIVVIDNRSQDRSLELAKTALQNLKHIKTTLLQNTENYSLGGSHKVAFNYALENNYDYCVVLHGDDQGSITDLIPYIESGEIKAYDSFLGARFARGSKLKGYSWFRSLGNLGLNFFCSLVTGYWVTDMGSGLNLYSCKYLQSRFYLYFPNDLTFNVYLLFSGCYQKSKFRFFPLTWREDDQVSNAKVFKQGMRILKLLITYIFSAKKLFSGQANEYSQINYRYQIISQEEAIENATSKK